MNQLKTIEVAMRAKTGIIWIKTEEELRVERVITELAQSLKYNVQKWTVTLGLVEVPISNATVANAETQDPGGALSKLLSIEGRQTAILCDFSAWLGDAMTMRRFKDAHAAIGRYALEQAKQVVVIDQNDPPKGVPGITVVEWSLPDRAECERILEEILAVVSEDALADVRTNGNRDEILSAMIGLQAEDAATAIGRSLAATGRIDPLAVASEKARIVRDSGLEWYDPDPRGMDAIGGLDNLKQWLGERQLAFSESAREFGLPSPKGMLLLGIPGAGKSLTCKCVAAAWKMPLLRLDVGGLFSKYVGESEGKVDAALKTAEAVAPCILWLDEIEKAMGQGSAESDGGTSSRVFGKFLSWMQDRKPGVFVVATANDLKPFESNPEFLRAGRWDAIWFVDTPNTNERVKIAEVMKGRFDHCDKVSARLVADATGSYTGAEIEQAFNEALYAAFYDGRKDVTTADVITAAFAVIPLSKTMGEKLDKLRKWSKGRARGASIVDAKPAKRTVRAIEA